MKRLDIKTGAVCNNNCVFCAQGHMKRFGNRTGTDIRTDLLKARKTGCESVVFTGGEPTIRDDIAELVRFAKQAGFREIQIQTNGRALSYLPLCRKLILAGASEFCFGLHGDTSKLHDSLTSSPGSFMQTTKAISNLVMLGARVMTNTVVVRDNYTKLPQIAKLLIRLKVNQFQLAFVHAVGNARINMGKTMPRMSEVSPYAIKALQMGIDNGLSVMAEAMTPCTLPGYEAYCSESLIPETEIRGIRQFDRDYKKTRIKHGKVKFKQCSKCIYFSSCEGPWKEYPAIYGSEEFKPIIQK